jgi:hypothetical protein
LRLCQLQPEIKEKPQLLANKGTRWRFKGLSQDVGRAEFAKNLRASPFNEGLLLEGHSFQLDLFGWIQAILNKIV